MLRLFVLLAALIGWGPYVAAAQSPYDPVITVNGDAITAYELDQRVRMLKSISQPGDLQALAREGLINDRLEMAAAKSAGVTVPDSAVTDEMKAFAARGGLSLDQFRSLLTRNGVEFDTFRRFISTGVAWRELIRSKYGSRVTISDDEIDRALTLASEGGLRVLLSEIVLPVPQGDTGQTLNFAKELQAQIKTEADFEQAARRYSASPSRSQGGKIDWIDLNKLPKNVQSTILGMTPGEVSPPMELPKAVVLFRLRSLAETPAAPAPVATLDYMEVRVPLADGGLDRARKMAETSDVCTDLYGKVGGLPAGALTRVTEAPDKIDPRIRRELSQLDPGETSTRLRSDDGENVLLLMLCARNPVIPQGETRDQIAQKLRGQRLQALADGYLAELKAAAQIVQK